MEAQDYLVGDVLAGNKNFLVPIYQRRYQWTDDELLPFWSDVSAKADEVLEDRAHFQHYLGALIWVASSDGLVTRINVVDGQQRLTTFQLLLAALREISTARQLTATTDEIDRLLVNSLGGIRHADKVKIVPTPADRDLIQTIVLSDRASLRRKYPEYYFQNGNLKTGQAPRALCNFLTLCKLIDDYACFGSSEPSERGDGEATADTTTIHARLSAIQSALLNNLKVVVIALGEGDDAQVIFETLNSKGRPLRAMDLVRNNIFHRAEAQGESAADLYRELWSTFEGAFWEQPAPRARPVRPRIDHFLSHALTAQTGRQTAIKELYAEYRSFARPSGRPRFERVEDELYALTQYASTYETLEGEAAGRTSLAWIGQKLAAWESTVAYPVVFQISTSSLSEEEKTACYRYIYSYIVRRAVCGLPNKSLGLVFSRLATRMLAGELSSATVAMMLRESEAATSRFPNDDEFLRGMRENPIYSWLSGGRLPDLLWELELARRSQFTEAIGRPDPLWIEHIMPQTWTPEWPDEEGNSVSLDRLDDRSDKRHKLIHTVGNLTLTTDALNISLSNESFRHKLSKLEKESLFVLNKDLQEHKVWTEKEIETRSRRLGELAARVMPVPIVQGS